MGTVGDVGTVVSLGIAGWAAYNAHRARAWQQRRDRERDQTAVRIDLKHGTDTHIGIAFIPDPDPRPYPLHYELKAAVINDGSVTEFVRLLEVVPLAEGVEAITLNLGKPADQYALPERGRVESSIRIYARSFRDFGDGFLVRAHLASGEIVTTGRLDLRPDILEQVTQQNQRAR